MRERYNEITISFMFMYTVRHYNSIYYHIHSVGADSHLDHLVQYSSPA